MESRIRVSFPPIFILISTLFITNSTSIPNQFPQIPYSKYCNDPLQQSQSTETLIPSPNLLKLDTAVYALGFQNPQFNFNPISPQIATFITKKAYTTQDKNIIKLNSVLNLIGPDIVRYFSGGISRRGLRLVKFRPPRFVPRGDIGAEFRLSGYWNSVTGKLCMVGSGSVSSLRFVNVVLKFNYPNSTVLDTSLINGSLESISLPGSDSYRFKPVSILGVSGMGYNFTFIDKEIKNGGFRVYDDNIENVARGTLNGRGLCSIITWGMRFELDYENYKCENVSCSFGPVGDEILPRFMSVKVVDCFEAGKVRYILQFSNSSYGKGLLFYPRTSLVAEGMWDEGKKRVALVACQVFDKMSLRGCSIRLAFSFPSSFSLKRRSSIVGKMWSSETENLGNVSFYSPANVNSRIKGGLYEYLEYDKVRNFCSDNLDSKRKTGSGSGSYPDEESPNLRFDMIVKNKKGQTAYGYASPLYIRDKFYTPFVNQRNHSLTNGYVNVSYVISFTARDVFDFGGQTGSKTVEISAEGVYNTRNGVLCMIGCKHTPYEKFSKRSLDCELVVNINFDSGTGMIRGNIKSTREKPDPLYFDPIEFGSSSITTTQAKASIYRMDLEITMVLISNTLACVFIGFQLFHVKKNPDTLPFISVVMLVVLTLGYMIPLLLNFEAVFTVNRKRNVFVGTDQWLEVNEVLVRVITMIAFLLQFRLLQLTFSSRNRHQNPKNLWVSDKKVVKIISPLYVAIGLTAWFVHSLRNTREKVTFWGTLESYTGVVLDTFLIPQIIFNLFIDENGMGFTILTPSFYIGSTMVRLLPHVYDLYRTHSSSWFYDKIYANPGMDYYSTMWDVVICCGGLFCVFVIYVQQRFGGRIVLPKRFRDAFSYEEVPVIVQEQELF